MAAQHQFIEIKFNIVDTSTEINKVEIRKSYEKDKIVSNISKVNQSDQKSKKIIKIHPITTL